MKIALLVLLIAVVFSFIVILLPEEKIEVETVNIPQTQTTTSTQVALEKPKTTVLEMPIIKKTMETITSTTKPTSNQLKTEKIEEVPINMQAMVALRCVFVSPNATDKRIAYGSGTIISDDGIILTARHLVDTAYIYEASNGRQGFYGYELSHCDVGFPKDSATTPTAEQIRKINPFTNIDFLPYVARIDFLPNTSELSSAEKSLLDVALIKIIGLSEDAKIFGFTALPDSFATNTLLGNALPKGGEEVITFGFPSGGPDYGSHFRLQGSVGHIKRILGGDQFFRNKPVEIESLMETIGGRSGSPLFWKGYVIGVVSFKEDNSINAFATSIIPLIEFLPK